MIVWPSVTVRQNSPTWNKLYHFCIFKKLKFNLSHTYHVIILKNIILSWVLLGSWLPLFRYAIFVLFLILINVDEYSAYTNYDHPIKSVYIPVSIGNTYKNFKTATSQKYYFLDILQCPNPSPGFKTWDVNRKV